MTSTNYHISADGMVRKCTAKTIENCRAQKVEGLEQHFTDKTEAQKAYEKFQEPIYPFSTPLNKPLNLDKKVNMDEQQFDEQKYIENSYEYFENLDDEDKQALTKYVQDSYSEINAHLWGRESDTNEYDVDSEIKALDKALAKHSGKSPKTVWRSFSGTDMNKIFHEQGYKVGDTITFNGYTSTAETSNGLTGVLSSTTWYMQETDSDDWETEPNSYRVKVPEEYAENGDKGRNTVLCIRPKNAAPVSMLRGRSTEQEWLIPRGASFKVSEVYENRELEGRNMNKGTYAHVYVLDEI